MTDKPKMASITFPRFLWLIGAMSFTVGMLFSDNKIGLILVGCGVGCFVATIIQALERIEDSI